MAAIWMAVFFGRPLTASFLLLPIPKKSMAVLVFFFGPIISVYHERYPSNTCCWHRGPKKNLSENHFCVSSVVLLHGMDEESPKENQVSPKLTTLWIPITSRLFAKRKRFFWCWISHLIIGHPYTTGAVNPARRFVGSRWGWLVGW